jgi:cytochrome c551
MRNRFKVQSLKFKVYACVDLKTQLISKIPPLYVILLTLNFLPSCSQSDPKFKQYYNQGEELYIKHCSNCHQKNGQGLGRVYPPLASSDYLKNNFNNVICLMRNGLNGSIVVNGKEFNQVMPGIPTLTDLEIAEITTYIYNTWGNERGLIDVKEVSVVLESCK